MPTHSFARLALCAALLCSAEWVCSIRAEGNMFGVQHVAVLPLVCFWIRKIHVYERLRLVVNEWTCQIDVLPPLLGYSFLANFIPNWRKSFVSYRTKEIEDKYQNAIEIHHLQLDLCIPRKFLRKKESHINIKIIINCENSWRKMKEDNSRNRLNNICARKWHGKSVENRMWTDKAAATERNSTKLIQLNWFFVNNNNCLISNNSSSSNWTLSSRCRSLVFLRGLRWHRHWDIDIIFTSISIIDSKSLAIFGAGSAKHREPQPEALPGPRTKAEPKPKTKPEAETETERSW